MVILRSDIKNDPDDVDTHTTHTSKAWVKEVQAELTTFYRLIQTFANLEPDEIMVTLAGISGRTCEVRAELVRREDRVAQKLRTMEVEPLIDECDRQFKLWSRIQSIRELDWKMSGGGT